jgi:hypothetical protein
MTRKLKNFQAFKAPKVKFFQVFLHLLVGSPAKSGCRKTKAWPATLVWAMPSYWL